MSQSTPLPVPADVLGSWAAIENSMTMLIAVSIVQPTPSNYEIFMQYAADRVPVREKIKMLNAIVERDFKESEYPYDGLSDDLQSINDFRATVAHSSVIAPRDGRPSIYWRMRRGVHSSLTEEEISEWHYQVVEKVARAQRAVTGMLFEVSDEDLDAPE